MNVAKKIKPVTLEEFEAMEKEDQFNYELLDGVVLMSPSPSFRHQEIGGNLHFILRSLLKENICKVIYELDIKFKENILKPDLMVFCGDNKELPEIIIEILSPSTRQHDLLYKLVKYQEMGIKEYWIVDPKTKTVTVHDFVHETAELYAIDETIQSLLIPEIVIAAADIFAS